jgi:hypothetical protein
MSIHFSGAFLSASLPDKFSEHSFSENSVQTCYYNEMQKHALLVQARKSFHSLLGEYSDEEISEEEFFLKLLGSLGKMFGEAGAKHADDKKALWLKTVERNRWQSPILPRAKREELLKFHLEGLAMAPEVSMNDLATCYNLSIPTVCAVASGLGVRKTASRAGRDSNRGARRPFRVYNFALLAGIHHPNKPIYRFSAKQWREFIIAVYREFKPRPVPVSRRLSLVSLRNLRRPVRYEGNLAADPSSTAQICWRYLALIHCENFMTAWEEIEKEPWMRLPGYVGLVSTDCLLDGPPLIISTQELYMPEEAWKGCPFKSRNRPNALSHHRATTIKELNALGASNLRRFVRLAEDFEKTPPFELLPDDEPNDAEWETIFARAAAESAPTR